MTRAAGSIPLRLGAPAAVGGEPGEPLPVGGDHQGPRLGGGGEIGQRGRVHQPAASDDDDLVDGVHLAEHVARHQHGAALGGEAAQQPAHPHDALGVEAVRGLVEDDGGRIGEQRGGEAEPLLHAHR